jgi:hypothetical protein
VINNLAESMVRSTDMVSRVKMRLRATPNEWMMLTLTLSAMVYAVQVRCIESQVERDLSN